MLKRDASGVRSEESPVIGSVCALTWMVLSQPMAVDGILPAGDIQISVSPDHLDLGAEQPATLTLHVFNADGTPQDQTPPVLLASMGTVDGLRRVAPGVFVASYLPPRSGSPRVAIILARTRTRSGLIAGWARIPLWGKGKVSLVTKPQSQVWLRIGETAFGPSESDQKGRANIAIRVPPGPRQGIAETLDLAGNTSKKTIDLGVRSFNRMAAFVLDESMVADGSEQSGLIAFVVDDRGDPLIEADIQVQVRRGQVGTVLPLAPGVYRIAYSSPREIGDGKDSVELSLALDQTSRRNLQIALTPGLPQRIELSVYPLEYRAGSAVRPVITLRAFDASGNVAPASLVDLTTQGGVLGNAQPAAQGAVRIPIELSDRFGGREVLVVRAEAVRGQAQAELRVPLLPDRCARITLRGPEQLIGDERRAQFTLRCTDRFDNPAPADGIQVTSALLLVENVQRADDEVRVTVRTPFLTAPDDATLLAQDGEARTSSRVHLLPGIGVQAVLGPRLVLGWAYGERWLTGAALDWSLGLPIGRDMLLVGMSLGALQSPSERPQPGLTTGVRRLLTSPLVFAAQYEKQVHPRIALHGGLSAGPLFVAPTLERNGARVDAALRTALLAEAILGAGLRLGDGMFTLDLRGGYALPLGDESGLGMLSGLSMSMGYRYYF
ncbi:MAG: hypothetical protein ABIJ09_15780 [Pseudomonadota bacterium]